MSRMLKSDVQFDKKRTKEMILNTLLLKYSGKYKIIFLRHTRILLLVVFPSMFGAHAFILVDMTNCKKILARL